MGLFGAGGFDQNAAQSGDAGKAFHSRGVRSNDDIVLVRAEHGSAFDFQHSEDSDGNVFDANAFSDGILVGEKLVGGGLAEDANLGGGADIGFGKHRAVGKVPLANGQIIHALTAAFGIPIVVSDVDLAAETRF